MKKIIITYLFLFCSVIFAQESQNRSYNFDTYKLLEIKNYGNNSFYESHQFSNSKDTTYVLELKYGKDKNEATLFIEKEKPEIIKFDLNFNYSELDDLNELNNSKLYTDIIRKNKQTRSKDFVEEMRFENDTIDNQVIVHLKQFKNNKKKKIINEHYYFLSNKNNDLKIDTRKNAVVNYLIEKYDLKIVKGLKLDRIMHLYEGKLFLDTYFQKYEKIDFLFNFKIEEVNTKPFEINFITQ